MSFRHCFNVSHVSVPEKAMETGGGMMGAMVYFCAGADANNLPVSPVEALLINALDHGSTPRKIQDAQE